jgi:hypothetical protein
MYNGNVKSKIEVVDGIYKTENISLPRSGHHLLKNILCEYFGDNLHYCSLYESLPELKMDENVKTNFQKNHDFDLKTLVKEDRKYIIQIREPIDIVESTYHLQKRVGTSIIIPNYESWRKESIDILEYCHQFVIKWIYTFVPNRLVMTYNDLILRPSSVMNSVIQHLCGKVEIDDKKLQMALSKFKPQIQLINRSVFYERA